MFAEEIRAVECNDRDRVYRCRKEARSRFLSNTETCAQGVQELNPYMLSAM